MNFYEPFRPIYKCQSCNEKALYAPKFCKVGFYCRNHKPNDMVSISQISCIESGCFERAIYKNSQNDFPKYCKKHKKENSIKEEDEEKNHKLRCYRCEEKGCFGHARYGFSNEKTGRFCRYHKNKIHRDADNIIEFNINICENQDCNEKAKYNYKHYDEVGGSSCFVHKSEFMINIYTELCSLENCLEEGIYGFNKTELFCSHHFEQGMEVQKDNICKTLFCEKKTKKEIYEGLCVYCYAIHNSSSVKKTKLRNIKEINVGSTLCEKLCREKYSVCFNKVIEGARPDIIIKDKQNEKIVMIEVDENQHENYTQKNEENRIINLLKNGDTKIIRFNPDQYTNSIKSKIQSCFTKDSANKCVLDRTKKKDWEKRINCLVETIKQIFSGVKNDELIYLFYDGFNDGSEQKYKKITEFCTEESTCTLQDTEFNLFN